MPVSDWVGLVLVLFTSFVVAFMFLICQVRDINRVATVKNVGFWVAVLYLAALIAFLAILVIINVLS